MLLSRLDFELPADLIADRPLTARDGARLLVVGSAGLAHRAIRDLPLLLPRGALLVVNDTRVLPARLLGHKRGSGGRVELLLLRRLADGPGARWSALGRASKPLREGTVLVFGEPADAAGIEATVTRTAGEGGVLEVALTPRGLPLDEALERLGHVPLPPYIRRSDEPDDRERYQTVFAREKGAVAAPTAGLHLSHDLLGRLADAGIERAFVTLHVGLGTFQPPTALDLDDHVMHAEWFAVPQATADAVASARARGAPVVAVGTTVVRALESAADDAVPGRVVATSGETRLCVQPGFAFRVVDRLVTNFHLPRSTLLALVTAFGGTSAVLGAYREAVARRYRFYSYGDAMLLEARVPPGEAAS